MTTALLLVDVQRNMLEGDNPVPSAASVRPALESLLVKARAAGVPVLHVQNDGGDGDPDLPFSTGWELVFQPADGEPVLRKTTMDTFASTDLGARLDGVERLVIAGMQSEYCITATSRGALKAGLAVVLPAGGHATYDDGGVTAADISAKVEQDLAAEGVTVTTAEEVAL